MQQTTIDGQNKTSLDMISHLHRRNKRRLCYPSSAPALCLLLLALGTDRTAEAMQRNSGEMLALAVDRHHNSPGHYEFEMAPNMEPPTVRKPPYQRSSFICPGSDVRFPSFSTKDTLCGDLNQGRVPQNPLGQKVGDESYPFEVIKNKTLQFLARALPVLKLEYETIPKVARYLPANHLLNPTHQSSPLASDHMHQLNQRLSPGNAFLDDTGLSAEQLSQLAAAGYPALESRAVRRRRKRALGSPSQQTAYLTVAEMSPNASLVVSSAHSSAGRIGNHGGASRNGVHHAQAALRLVDSQAQPSMLANRSELGVITKDGFKTITANSPVTSSTLAAKRETTQRPQSSAVAGEQSGEQIGARNNQIVRNNGSAGDNRQQQLQFKSSPSPANGTPSPIPPQDRSQQQQQQQHIEKTFESRDGQQQPSGRSQGDLPVMQTSGHQSSGRSDQPTSGHNNAKSQSRRLNCGDSSNGFTSVICQAASALIEGDRVPVWLQMARSIGSAYSSASTEQSNPVWSLLTSLVGSLGEPANQAKSAGSSSSSGAVSPQTKANLLSLVKPLTSLVSGAASVTAQDKSDNKQESAPLSSANSLANTLTSSTWARLMMAGWVSNALTGLVEYLVPSVGSRTFAKRKKPFDPQETFVDTPASVAAALSASNALKQAGVGAKPPPTPCPSTEEYISPTFARNHQGAWKYVVQIPHEGYFTQTIQRTSCVRQRCEFTEGVCHESPRWVSLLVAEIYYPNAIFNQPVTTGIDPNAGGFSPSQMATASSTNNMVLAQQQHQQQQQQQQLQHKDPLQMTDSLTNYNHNLNNAFISAANDLGWDPNNVQNMQQLAAAYKYQLLSRNGLLTSQQQPAEARMAVAQSAPSYSHVQVPAAQQMSNAAISAANSQAANQAIYNSDYITALALAALQQNPNLNVEELVNSLYLQASQQQASSRKKRDLNQASANTGQWSHQVTHYSRPQTDSDNIQPRSSGPNVEAMNSPNELGSLPKQASQQQQLAAFAKQTGQQGSVAMMQQAGQLHEQHNMAQPGANGGANQQANMHDANTAASGDATTSQVECDGHDKIGCYVVRVYYDWFLVNGSCKCWKTNLGQQGGSSSSSGGNSLLRRIFTG